MAEQSVGSLGPPALIGGFLALAACWFIAHSAGANAAPQCSISYSAPEGSNGWKIGNGQLTVSAVPGSTPIANVTVSLSNDTAIPYVGPIDVWIGDGNFTVICRAEDVSGLNGTQLRFFRVDSTPPDCTLRTIDGGDLDLVQSGRWHARSEIGIAAVGTDPTSGVAEVRLVVDGVIAGPEARVVGDGKHKIECTARDRAGNHGSRSFTIGLDGTPPTPCALEFVGVPMNERGWYRKSPSVEALSNDALSGSGRIRMRSNSSEWWDLTGRAALGLADGVHRLMCEASDNAGNAIVSAAEVRIDGVPPRACAIHQGDAALVEGSQNWRSDSPGLRVSATDAASGVDFLEVTVQGRVRKLPVGAVFSVEDEGVSQITCTPFDVAGNRGSTFAVDVVIDRTPPVCALRATRAPDSGIWYRSRVDLTIDYLDEGSHVAARELLLDGTSVADAHNATVDEDGKHTAACHVTNTVGLHGAATKEVHFDGSPPGCLVRAKLSEGPAWTRIVSLIPVDDLSGVATTAYSDGRGTFAPYVQPFQIAADVANYACEVVDEAGNRAVVQFDVSPPLAGNFGVEFDAENEVPMDGPVGDSSAKEILTRAPLPLGGSFVDDLLEVSAGESVKIRLRLDKGGPIDVLLTDRPGALGIGPLNLRRHEVLEEGAALSWAWRQPPGEGVAVFVDVGERVGRPRVAAEVSYARWDSFYAEFEAGEEAVGLSRRLPPAPLLLSLATFVVSSLLIRRGGPVDELDG